MTEQAVEPQKQEVEVAEEQEPTVEERLADAIKKNGELVQAYNQMAQRANGLETALTMANAKNAQLEANIEILRDHREMFMEREADAFVNAKLTEQRLTREVKEAETKCDNIEKEHQPLRARIHQAETALAEVRDLFGKVKHKQKESEREASENAAAAENAQNALEWYVSVSAGVRFSIPHRFFKEAGHDLTFEDIVQAYLVARGSNVDVDSKNIVEFLLTPSKFQ